VQSAKAIGNKRVVILSLCSSGSYARMARTIAKQQSAIFFNGQSFLQRKIPEIKNGSIYPEYVKAMESQYGDQLRQNDIFYVSSDGCHPNALGHRLVADELAKLIEPVITQK